MDSIFPLHNHAFNRQWIKQWSSKSALKEEDISEIRDKFGEKIAFYFAFLQSYFSFLVFPAAFGFGAWLILGQYSWFYALVNSLWSVVFFEYWKKKEVDLAVQWGVRGVSRIQHPRTSYKWDHEAVDPITREPIKVYPARKRLQTQLLQVPFALVCLLILGALYVFCFSIEIFLGEIYNGPLKAYLVSLKAYRFLQALNILISPDFFADHYLDCIHADAIYHSQQSGAEVDRRRELPNP